MRLQTGEHFFFASFRVRKFPPSRDVRALSSAFEFLDEFFNEHRFIAMMLAQILPAKFRCLVLTIFGPEAHPMK